MKKTRYLLLVLALALGLTACSGKKESAESILEKAIEREEKIVSQYSKNKILAENPETEVKDQVILEEWISFADGKTRRRTETKKGDFKSIAVSNEDGSMSYQEEDNTLYKTKVTNQSGKTRILEELLFLKDGQPKPVGQEKLGDNEVYHIGYQDQGSSMDIYISKEDYRVLKTVNTVDKTAVTVEIVETKDNLDLSDEIFILDYPEDAKVVDADEKPYNIIEIRREDIKEKFGQDVLFFGDKFKPAYINYVEFKESGEKAINVGYVKEDKPFFDVNIVEEKEIEIDETVNKPVTIRGQKGYIMEGEIRLITFYDSGLQYGVLIIDPEITIEEVIEEIEAMKF